MGVCRIEPMNIQVWLCSSREDSEVQRVQPVGAQGEVQLGAPST